LYAYFASIFALKCSNEDIFLEFLRFSGHVISNIYNLNYIYNYILRATLTAKVALTLTAIFSIEYDDKLSQKMIGDLNILRLSHATYASELF
jgi:hypothetical protein